MHSCHSSLHRLPIHRLNRFAPVAIELADVLRSISLDLVALVCDYLRFPTVSAGSQPHYLFRIEPFRSMSCYDVGCSPVDGSVWLACGRYVQRFDADGRFLNYIGVGRWQGACNVACDSDGGAVVADSHGQFLAMCKPDGSLTRDVANRTFLLPNSVSIAQKEQLIFFANQDPHWAVQCLTMEGVFVRAWGSRGVGDGKFDGPAGISASPFGEVAVSDTGNHRIQV